MKIDVLTLFPAVFQGAFEESIIARAVKKGKVKINLVNIRDFGLGRHKTVDDKPYSGGAGMIMRMDVIANAIAFTKLKTPASPAGGQNSKLKTVKEKIVLLDPAGEVYNQKIAQEFSKLDHLILICGHYEGVDNRIEKFVDRVISIGDYVLTGGEIPTMVIVDSVVRLIPGVLSKKEATKNESFSYHRPSTIDHRLLEYPQYTRPENFRGLKVPRVLLSGNHQEVARWRLEQALKRTKKRRPDLLKQ